MRRLLNAVLLVGLFFVSAIVRADCTTQPWVYGTTSVTTLCGSVGIGTAAPTVSLHVFGNAENDAAATMGFHSVNGPAFNFGYSGASFGRSTGFFNIRPDPSAAPPNPSLRFMTSNSQRMIITNVGNIGIGVITTPLLQTGWPSALLTVGETGGTGNKLIVNGDVTVTGNIAAKYQDVAEWVPASGDMEAGTVVVLNPAKANEVMRSSSAYDASVAGVVSAQPGIILGEASPSKVRVATTGRVKVRVDATKAPIRIGDLLVTSGKVGIAMRSEGIDLGGVKIHRPGTLIGKALEPLDDGEGEILVLLSLQ